MKTVCVLMIAMASTFSIAAMAECSVDKPVQEVIDCIVSEAADNETFSADGTPADPIDTAETTTAVKVM